MCKINFPPLRSPSQECSLRPLPRLLNPTLESRLPQCAAVNLQFHLGLQLQPTLEQLENRLCLPSIEAARSYRAPVDVEHSLFRIYGSRILSLSNMKQRDPGKMKITKQGYGLEKDK